jgi:serine/threonine-protein kinase SRPK3
MTRRSRDKNIRRELPEFLCDEEHNIDWRGHVLSSNKNRYIFIKRIGYGSYSSVWMVHKLSTSVNTTPCFYAIKVHHTKDAEEGAKEAKLYKKFKELGISNILSPVDEFTIIRKVDDNTLKHVCVVMDLMACSVYELLTEGEYTDGLPFDTVVDITRQILVTLSNLHTHGIIHTDIKPENILLKGETRSTSELITIISRKTNINGIKKHIEKHIDMSDGSSDEMSFPEDEQSDESDSESIEDEKQTDDMLSLLSISSEETDSEEETEEAEINIKINTEYIDKPVAKLADMGTCLTSEEKRRKHIQTRHYKSPEVILRTGYDTKSDMWALGCTIYEMLTGEVLFNPNDRFEHKTRYQLQLTIQKLGRIPDHMIEKSPYRELYFDGNYVLKNQEYIKYDDTWDKLFSHMNTTDIKKNHMLDLVFKLLTYDPVNRLDAESALNHPLFAMTNNQH